MDYNQFESYLWSTYAENATHQIPGVCTTAKLIHRVDKKKIENHESCVICMEDLHSTRKQVGRLACGHVFHHRCVDRWLRKSATCPVCRTRVA